jgi:hypothetical protein
MPSIDLVRVSQHYWAPRTEITGGQGIFSWIRISTVTQLRNHDYRGSDGHDLFHEDDSFS